MLSVHACMVKVCEHDIYYTAMGFHHIYNFYPLGTLMNSTDFEIKGDRKTRCVQNQLLKMISSELLDRIFISPDLRLSSTWCL